MRPIDFCTPKPFPLEHSCSRRFPAQRLVPARGLSALARVSPSSRSLAAPCSSTPASSLACRSARPKTREPGTGRLGATRCRRDWGEPRFTARFPLRRSALDHATAFSSVTRQGYRSPLTPLSPPPGSWAWAAFGESHALARRPPRPVPRRPRERRAHSRSRVSSVGSRDAHCARAEARTKPRLVHRSRRPSRDEDGRASMNRPPFATGGLLRLRA